MSSSTLQIVHPRAWRQHVSNAAILCALAALCACSDGNSSEGSIGNASAQTYSLSATISGLDSSGLVLMVNARRQRIDTDLFYMINQRHISEQALMIDPSAVSVAAGQTAQGLASSLPSGTGYFVMVQTQP